MELTVHVVCRPEIAAGFGLAGIVVDVADARSAGDVVVGLARTPSVGVVLVEQCLHGALPVELRQRLDRRAFPVVVTFPSPSWEDSRAAEDYVLELLRQAVGYRVKLQ